jgi:ribonucleoside-diphosphate reductase alpha chain
MSLTPLAGEVLKKRYLARNYRGEIIETPADVFSRVARVVAEADRLFDAGASVRDTADRFEAAMTSLAFMPNSPCLMNAGRPLGQLAACFVLPVEDNLESIFQSLKDAALIHHTGGGTGFSFSRLRPSGDTIFPASGVTGGPVSFIQLFDAATHLIDRNRVRPGANMGVLHVSHPDIEAFVSAKRDRRLLCNFNLSVAVDDEFIACVKADRDYPLIHPRTGALVNRVSAVDLLRLMADSAWESGDPGILFIDRINRANPTPEMGSLEATNPCGEQPLLPYESCTLGSINLTRIVDGTAIDFNRLESLVHLAVHFLDNVVEVNRHPIATDRGVEPNEPQDRVGGDGVCRYAHPSRGFLSKRPGSGACRTDHVPHPKICRGGLCRTGRHKGKFPRISPECISFKRGDAGGAMPP